MGGAAGVLTFFGQEAKVADAAEAEEREVTWTNED